MKKKVILAQSLAVMLALTACAAPEQSEGAPVVSGSVSNSEKASGSSESTPTPSAGQSDEMVYGTASLTYQEFFSGDVTSTGSFDAVSSATTSKYEIMPNMLTDFKDPESNAGGYHITGVKNVNVAVAASDYEAYMAVNPTFVRSENGEPVQYKTVLMEDGKAVYSETKFNVADTVTDAKAELITGGNWGDYQINVTDGAKTHLRNTREDEFDINSQIQGIILETDSGLKVGMEHLQSIWVQPYEVSFNVLDDNSHNTHIAAYDNLPELSKLVGEDITKITYIMPDSAYVYEFDGIYIKPIYKGEISASVPESYDAVTISTNQFDDFENGMLTVTYTLGSGRSREVTTLLETPLTNGTDTYGLNTAEIASAQKGGVYSAVISSESYANITVALPATEDQKAALQELVTTAQQKLTQDAANRSLEEHIQEAEELLGKDEAASAEIGSLIAELTQLTSDGEEKGGSGEKKAH